MTSFYILNFLKAKKEMASLLNVILSFQPGKTRSPFKSLLSKTYL